LVKNSNDTSCLAQLNNTSNIDNKSTYLKHMRKQIYLRKLFLALYIQFYAVCYDKDLEEEKNVAERYLPYLQACYDKKFNKIFTAPELDGVEEEVVEDIEDCNRVEKFKLGIKALEIFSMMLDYADQFRKKSTVNSKFLKSNSIMESNLKLKLSELHAICVEQDCFYHYWIFNILIDFFIASISIFLYQNNSNQKFLQESFVVTFSSITFMYSENTKYLYIANEYSTDNISKSSFFKPVYFFQYATRFIAILLKSSTNI
jgi:hypothetical protein